MKKHVGFDRSGQSSVYLEYIFSEDSDSVTKAKLKCPDASWVCGLHGLTAEEAGVLADDAADKNKRYEIYAKYLPDEKLREIEFF